MADPQPAPLIQLEAGGTAPVLRYDVPEPTSYAGKNFIELEFDDDVFAQEALAMPSNVAGDRLSDLPEDSARAAIASYLRTGISARAELPDVPVSVLRRGLTPTRAQPATPVVMGAPPETPPEPDDDYIDDLRQRIDLGYHLVKGEGIYGEPGVTVLPPVPEEPDPHLYLVETLRLTSYLGDYGAGRIVKTFSLLPGEVTTISVKTYRQTESTSKSASSVLDSLTQESATDLETSVETEQSDQKSFAKADEYYADVSASAKWGWGSASGKAGVKGSSNATREEAVKNVSNATEKHSASASAKREVEVNTSYEVSEKAGEEVSIERRIENINLSRTLNFIFRQLNQEFVTFLHLTDIRIGFFNGDGKSTREVPLSALDRLLDEVIKPAKRAEVRSIILEQLSAVRDHVGDSMAVTREITVAPGDTYLQFNTDLATTFEDKQGREYEIPGVLLNADYLTMRTEGVIVEAMLGNGPALDSYAERLQELEVQRRAALVAKDEKIAAQLGLVNEAISSADESRAGIAERLCRCYGDGQPHEPGPQPSPGNP
jgi:hypothetical protein